MSGLTCLRVGALLARGAVGSTDAEWLRVESHCRECQRCREEARVLEGSRAAPSREPVLSSATRELVLRRAFDAASLAPSSSPASASYVRRRPWAAATLVAAAAAVALAVLALRARSQALGSAPQTDHVASGFILSQGRQAAPGALIPAGTELDCAGGARLALGHADVELTAASRVVWRPAESTLVLVGGRVHVAVEHVEHQHFRVATPAFVVEVVGTAFNVDLQGVQVSRGTVHVLSSDGHDVLAVLPAGGAWSTPAPAAAADPEPATAPSPSPSLTDASPLAPSGVNRDLDSTKSVRQWLSNARHALSAHGPADAQRAVEAALRLHPTNNELAEARTLLAECAGASGDSARAVRLYLAVARQFPALPAAENALFAAARTEDRVGARQAAQQLFIDYLSEYPSGRFRGEAERHLVQLKAKPTDE
ncbi:MAG TPA: FecR domain-containing protein [Polyangiaceae bacterium]|nr:FecR domain-containing protein [Polyangiaceae bacterium]